MNSMLSIFHSYLFFKEPMVFIIIGVLTIGIIAYSLYAAVREMRKDESDIE